MTNIIQGSYSAGIDGVITCPGVPPHRLAWGHCICSGHCPSGKQYFPTGPGKLAEFLL